MRDPIKNRAAVKVWRKENPELRRVQQARERVLEKTKVRSRRSHLRRAFGITPEQYADLLTHQENRCATCRSPEPRAKSGWRIDHDAKTGEVRGILCHACNITLGFGEKHGIPLAREFKDYLASPPARQVLKTLVLVKG